MAFTELFNGTITPEEYTVLVGATQAGQNFLVQCFSIGDDEVQPCGYLIWRIYIPFPVDKYAVIRSEGVQQQSQLYVAPLPQFTGLNVEVGYYVPRSLTAKQISLSVE